MVGELHLINDSLESELGRKRFTQAKQESLRLSWLFCYVMLVRTSRWNETLIPK